MTDKKVAMRQTRTGPPPMEAGKIYINPAQEDQMEICGYRQDKCRTVVTWVAIVLTVGFLRLVFHWKPEWMLRCTHVQCALQYAEKVLLKDQYDQWFVHRIKIITLDGVRVENADPSARFTTGPGGSHDKEPQPAVIVENGVADKDTMLLKFFVNKKVKYIWDPEKVVFEKLKGLEENLSCSYFHEATGLSEFQQARKRVLYGDNAIIVHVQSIIKLLVTQALNPFYVFQLFSVILWYNDEYEYYATCILIVSIVSLSLSIYQTRRMQRALKSTITASGIISVSKPNGEFYDVPTDLLVPGDVVEVPRHGCTMQCDAVLVSGNCIVNESMLTGESVPVTKTPIPNPKLFVRQQDMLFNMKDHARHVLFCGTQVIQTRYYGNQKVRAVVIRTGFSTSKGELVRSIMFPKPVDFKFSQDSFKFIGVLFLIASLGMIYTLILMISRGNDAGKIVLRTLDLITIVIPPALPAAMTVGIVFAQNRLKSAKVFCISPRSINLCGAINAFCFDKTGTLTEDGLDLWGVLPVIKSSFQAVGHSAKELGREAMMICMATCHSLTIIEGEISGDPLDLKMFEATGWELEEPGEDTAKFDVFMPTVVRPPKPDIVKMSETYGGGEDVPFEVGILRQFTFSSRLQRMSVIARTLGSQHFDLFAKGAPEMIASLCKPETVPFDFHDVLMQYTMQGYRVIALAWKPLHKLNYVKVQRAQREQMECNLEFLGLLIMENRVKPQTTPIIQQLKNADIRTIMVTGDNMLTALSVARDCQMIEPTDKTILVHVVPPIGNQQPYIEWTYAEDTSVKVKEVTTGSTDELRVDIEPGDRIHFAITGKSWGLVKQHFPELISKLVVRGTVYARMSPEQKAQLVETLQGVGYYVGMCGDGANDCGALKTAHAGISLSETEASVASPFTSKEPNISCVPTVIREGRCALVTSFGIFKYMATYSLTQFTTVCILYWISANLTDFTFLYIDMILLTTLSISFGYTKAYPQLVPKPPTVSLLSLMPILSIVVQMIIIIAFQIFIWFFTQRQPWFVPFVPNDDDDYQCHDVTGLVDVSSFQYIILAVVLSKGAPYRKHLLTNYPFVINVVILVAVTIYIVMYPFPWLVDLMELQLPDSLSFRGIYIGIAALNFFICYLVETYIIDTDLVRENLHEPLKKRFSKGMFGYQHIEQELSSTPHWPPVSQSTTNLASIMRMESVTSDLADLDPGDGGGLEAGDRIRPLTESSESAQVESAQAVPRHLDQVGLDLAEPPYDTDISSLSSPDSPKSALQLSDGSGLFGRGTSLESEPLVRSNEPPSASAILLDPLETTSL